MSPPILALVADGTGQSNRPGSVHDSNMWKVASQVADHIVYASGIGVNQRFSMIRMATGWGGGAKARYIAKTAGLQLKQLVPDVEADGLSPVVVGFGGSRGCAVLLKACALLGVPIHAIVLFDAVYSFGLFWWSWLDRHLYPFEVPGNIRHALHLVGEHENTPGFRPVLYPSREGLLQVRMSGDHTEVLRGPEAERIALSWLSTVGIPKRFEPSTNGWGQPTRHLDSLPYYSP